MDISFRQKISIRLLALFNVILLGISWVMMMKAFPRLPELIPYWLPLAGQEILRAPKGLLFFLYPVFQTLFLLAFYLAGTVWIKKPESPDSQTITGRNETGAAEISRNGRAVSGERKGADRDTAWSGQGESRPGDLGSGSRSISTLRETEAAWPPGEISPGLKAALINLKKELVLLLLIFFNLVFIHMQRSLIWLAHGLSAGVNKFYFFLLLVIILLLIPYYHFNRQLIQKARL